jgi:hypothetical protein
VYVHPKLPRRGNKVSMDIKDLEVCCAHGGGVCECGGTCDMWHVACVCDVVWCAYVVVAVMGWGVLCVLHGLYRPMRAL